MESKLLDAGSVGALALVLWYVVNRFLKTIDSIHDRTAKNIEENTRVTSEMATYLRLRNGTLDKTLDKLTGQIENNTAQLKANSVDLKAKSVNVSLDTTANK